MNSTVFARLSPICAALWAFVSFLLVAPVLVPLALALRHRQQPWVFGGHRGRLYADNAGMLHAYLCQHTEQRSVWIGRDEKVRNELKRLGRPVLPMHSLAARWAILRAPVLIYSHGESDLDLCLVLLRRILGFRIYLNHSMNYLKAGEFYNDKAERLRGLSRWLFGWTVTDFDVLLANSPLEAANFRLSYPHQQNKIVLGGGAHLDAFFKGKAVPRARTILYFPTFREDVAGQSALNQVIETLVGDPELQAYLQREGLTLQVGAHINSKPSVATSSAVEWIKPGDILPALFACELFISDYSGLIFDYLVLEKPMVHFPFDLADYLKHRRLYTPYEEIACGPIAQSVHELIAIVTSNQWVAHGESIARAHAWRQRVIKHSQPVYCDDSYRAILRELAVRAPKAMPSHAAVQAIETRT